MAADRDQATEPPSRRKLKQARKQGQVAYSRELSSTAAVAAGCLALALSFSTIVEDLSGLSTACFSGCGVEHWRVALEVVFSFAARICGVAAAAALAAGLVQVGWKLHFKLQLRRLDPLAGLRRMFSRQRLADLAILLARLVALGAVGVYCLLPAAASVVDPGAGLESGAGGTLLVVRRLVVGTVMAALVFGLADRWIQRRRFLRRQRMTKQEVLRERREQEGDPALKSERRRRHRKLQDGSGGVAALRRASVLVVNPTHVAVALRYVPGEDEAPVVVASGWNLAAARLRAEAARIGLPVVQHVPLARALVRTEPGEEIPESLYEATAQVIRAVQQIA